MSIITISRGSYSRGKEIAEKLAQKLGYECISRDILLEASDHFNIPEVKLIHAIHDAPSILERFKHGKERYIAFIREAFLEHVAKGNVVYHGLAGQFFARGIPNVLKIRIIANIEDRIKEEMNRNKYTEKKAHCLLLKDDAERRKWSRHLYGIDTRDPNLYDTVMHINTLRVDNVVEILADIAKQPCFQPTQESQMIIKDMRLAAEAKATIFKKYPLAEVRSKDGVVYVRLETALSLEEEISAEIKNILKYIDKIKDVRVSVIPYDTF